MSKLPDDEWRLEVELDDERHGFPLSEHLRAHDLDDEARERLGGRVIVTRDGSRLYLYTTSAGAAREAERVVRELLDADGLTADTRLTRWNEAEDAWVAPSGEMVDSGRDEDELADYFVRVEPKRSADVDGLAERLRADGLPVERRGQYLLIGSQGDAAAEALAQRVRAIAGPEDDVQVRAEVADLPSPSFLFFETHKPGIARDLGL
jgi:hypothetical protein